MISKINIYVFHICAIKNLYAQLVRPQRVPLSGCHSEGATQWVPLRGCHSVGATQWVPLSGCHSGGIGFYNYKYSGQIIFQESCYKATHALLKVAIKQHRVKFKGVKLWK